MNCTAAGGAEVPAELPGTHRFRRSMTKFKYLSEFLEEAISKRGVYIIAIIVRIIIVVIVTIIVIITPIYMYVHRQKYIYSYI